MRVKSVILKVNSNRAKKLTVRLRHENQKCIVVCCFINNNQKMGMNMMSNNHRSFLILVFLLGAHINVTMIMKNNTLKKNGSCIAMSPNSWKILVPWPSAPVHVIACSAAVSNTLSPTSKYYNSHLETHIIP